MSSEPCKTPSRRLRFSLRHMLVLTALVAVWFAVMLALQKNIRLTKRRADLLGLSSQLIVADAKRLQSVSYPGVAKDLKTWEVHVPEGQTYELRFGLGTVSQAGMPERYEKIPLAAGQHRITLYTADNVEEEFHYTVFLDGQTVYDQSMGREWMPNGWRQASGLSAPEMLERPAESWLHLSGEAYTPRQDFGSGTYFNGQSDGWVSLPGYRLWIDQADQSYPPASPFIGFPTDPEYLGIGLRDGLRYRASRNNQYAWTIGRPASQTNDPVLTIVPEFYVGDKLVLPDQTKAFSWWRMLGEPQGELPVAWFRDPSKTTYSVFLHPELKAETVIKPVVELRWDAGRPDAIGLRLAATPANESLTAWRLRITEGASHLWRLVDVGERQLDVRTHFGDSAPPAMSDPLPLDIESERGEAYRIGWKTDVTKPLQMLERERTNDAQAYRGMTLFRGLPLAFEAELPASLHPQVSIVGAQRHPDKPDVAIPGGAVIDEIQIQLDASNEDWIWLRAGS